MNPPDKAERIVIGAMTGTSLDGIDVALVRLAGHGLEMEATLLKLSSRSLGELAADLRRASRQNPRTAGEFARLAWDFSRLHVEAMSDLIGGKGSVDLIAASGQTIYHAPPISWQLFNPAAVARRFGCPVVFDLRQADLAAGGQGAPITPLADWILFRDAERQRAIVNFGGFCNVTILPRADDPEPVSHILGFDVCACNHLLDTVARKKLKKKYDEDGQAALAGSPDGALTASLRELLSGQIEAGRSLGTDDEAVDWVLRHQSEVSAENLAATAVNAIAGCTAARLNDAKVDDVILAGGGAHNDALVRAMSRACNAEVFTSEKLGMPIAAREAVAIAVLGALSADGVPITLPQVTGCEAPSPVAGSWCLPTAAAFAQIRPAGSRT